jgi:hypothetical protein
MGEEVGPGLHLEEAPSTISIQPRMADSAT